MLAARVAEARRLLEEPEWAAGAVIIENGQGEVLLLKRGSTAPWMPGKWNLPGGNVDPGENPLQTAVREAEEETRLIVTGLRLVARTRLKIAGESGLVHVFTTKDFRGTPKVTWENSEMRWVPKAEAPSFDLVPGIRGALQKVAK